MENQPTAPVTIGKRTPLEGTVEWCFKLDNEEAVVFGVSESATPLTIEIPAEQEANIVFTSASGKKFEIFPRTRVDEAEVVQESTEPAHEDAAQ